MRLINLTGHPLRITDGESIVVIPSVGRARVVSKNEVLFTVEDDSSGIQVPVEEIVEQKVINIPAPAENTIYIVSGLVAAHAQREDVFAPGRLIRDNETGRITACRNFIRPTSSKQGSMNRGSVTTEEEDGDVS